MKKFSLRIFSILTLMIVALASTGQSLATAESVENFQKERAEKTVEKKLEVEHEDDVAIVKFHDGVSDEQIEQVKDKNNSEVVDKSQIPERFQEFMEERNIELVKTDGEKDLKETLVDYEMENLVEEVDVNVVGDESWTDVGGTKAYPDDFDSDPSYADGDHWYYEKTNLPELWHDQNCHGGGAGCGGDSEVVVAVLDTGLAYESYTDGTSTFSAAPEIDGINLWQNSAEVSGSAGVDDDGNSYCDDKYGFDMGRFVYNWLDLGLANNCSLSQVQHEGHPNDDNGHGTFVTSIIASLTNNGASNGSIGAAHNVSIMSIKTNKPLAANPNSLSWAFGVLYAIDHGADIITTSVVFTGDNQMVKDVVDEAYDAGITFVAATGNDNTTSYYPARYSTVLGVGALNKDDSRSCYSNYGAGLDLVAPVGQDGASCAGGVPDNYMVQQSYVCFVSGNCGSSPSTDFNDVSDFTLAGGIGTSFAAPQVAAAAAIIKSVYPNEGSTYLGSILRASSTDIAGTGSGVDADTGYGLLNMEKMLDRTGLYHAVIGTNDGVYTRFTNNDSYWSDWQISGGTNSRKVNMITFDGKLYQALRGTNDVVYTRYMENGSGWTGWTHGGGVTIGDVEMEVFDGKLWQTVRGTDNGVYTRYYDTSTGWSSWTHGGGWTISDPTMEVFDNKIWQSVTGTNLAVYYRTYEVGTGWSAWQFGNGWTSREVTMINFNDTHLFQSVRGTNQSVYTRYYETGSGWSSWEFGAINTTGNAYMAELDSKVYQVIRGTDNRDMTRYWESGSGWSSWVHGGGYVASDVHTTIHNSRLYQTAMGTDSAVYYRSIAAGGSWTSWTHGSGWAGGDVTIASY